MSVFHKIGKKSKNIIQTRVLLEEIQKTKAQMDCAYVNFQYALEPDLIDYYIYEGNAAWKRYCFLLHLLREGYQNECPQRIYSTGNAKNPDS